jgi:hypothetical protein
MLSRARIATLLSCLALSVGAVSCGDKKPAAKIMPQSDTGCYDQLGSRVRRFFDGSIDQAEWESTFDCVKTQITFFRKYVVGEEPGGYNQADIAALIRKFLIVERPVSDAFIVSLFDLKASVFGGKSKIITYEDLDEFIRLNEVLRRESLALLPQLRARRAAPSNENLLRLADGIDAFGANLSKYVSGLKGTLDVKKESYIPFARELITINGGDGSLVDKYADFVTHLKVVIAGGKATTIEKNAWSTIVREGASFGGLLFAYREMEDHTPVLPEDRDAFMVDLVRRARDASNRVISRHGRGIPLELFNPVIDTLPSETLTREKRAAVKKDLRAVVRRGLQGGADGWLTTDAIDTASAIYERGMTSQMHLKRIYRALPENAQRKDFEAAARRYQSSVGTRQAQAQVDDLIEISKNFVGLFPENSGRVVYTNAMRETRTRNHMIRMSWFRTAVYHLFRVYATGPEVAPGRRSAQQADLSRLIGDYNDILLEWKLSNPNLTIDEMAEKRFREGNLFTPISNGDKLLDDVETTYYMAYLFSASSLSGDIFDKIVHDWRACPIVGTDELGQEAISAACFRRFYFDRPETFWKSFPGLQVAYAKMSPEQKGKLAYAMEQAARTKGYNEGPIGPFDIDSFSALPHYVESVMERFDSDDNEVLDRREILDQAFPIFRETLRKAQPGKPDLVLKGILTYIIHYGEAPPDAASLLFWIARMPFTKIEADRVALYQVVAAIGAKSTD